jgi:acyl carrier protein
MITKDSIVTFLQTQLGLEAGTVDENTKLFTSGLLDSFSIVDMVLFIESEENIKIDPADLIMENFDSVADIMRFSLSKRVAR